MFKSDLYRKTKAELIEELETTRRRLAESEAANAEHLGALDALRGREESYRILLDESSDPIFSFYPDGTYRYVNRVFAMGVGKPLDEIIGNKIWDVFSQEEADKRYAVIKRVFAGGEIEVIEVRVPREDGDQYYITTVKPILDDQGEVISVICISKDITERKQMEDELHYLGTHDLLTGVYNRNFLEVELARFQNSRLYPISIVVADLDNLKKVNDRYGHAAGDELLRNVARSLQESFRVEDIVARIGGDEFAVLLPKTDQAAAQTIVERLRTNLAQGRDMLVRLSIGVAAGQDGCDLNTIMRLADDRMYQDKLTHL